MASVITTPSSNQVGVKSRVSSCQGRHGVGSTAFTTFLQEGIWLASPKRNSLIASDSMTGGASVCWAWESSFTYITSLCYRVSYLSVAFHVFSSRASVFELISPGFSNLKENLKEGRISVPNKSELGASFWIKVAQNSLCMASSKKLKCLFCKSITSNLL